MKPHRLTYTIPNARRDLLSGRKRQTMRLLSRHGDIKPGDPLDHLVWVGKPRQKGSRLEHVLSATCSEAKPYVVRLDKQGAPAIRQGEKALEPLWLSQGEMAILADRDGFDSWEELVVVLRGFYGARPVEMVAILW